MTALYAVFQLTIVLIGLAIGSFLNVVILRLPEGRSIAMPPSHCPVCETPLAWYDNLPIVSWLVLGARCRTCHTPISPAYPLIELLTANLAWLVAHRFVPTAAELDLAHGTAALAYFAFTCLLVVAAFTDLRTRIIPDEVSIYAVPAALGLAWLLEWVGYVGWLDHGLRGAALGATFAGGGLWIVSTLWYRITGQEGLALGDVKLMALIGAFLGPAPGPLAVLLLASLAGSVWGLAQMLRTRSTYLPFAPLLAVSAITWVLYGDQVDHVIFPGLLRLL